MKREGRADYLFIRCYVSSNVNEVIRTVLNSLSFFLQKAQKSRGHNQTKALKAPKSTKSTKSTKTQPSKSTKRYKRIVRVWRSHYTNKNTFIYTNKN